jgi:CubicO group peptidase (beta-lactamase class C family)
VDEQTYFRTASLTKLVTGIGLMRLVDQGLLKLDEDIGGYFGYPIRNGYYPDTSITLRQLMSHTSSIADTGGYSVLSNRVADLLAASLNRRSNFKKARPGSSYAYSNFGAGLTGSLVEAVTGLTIDDYMRAAVFDPLNIDASYSATRLSSPGDVSNQYKDGKLNRAASGALAKAYEPVPDPERHFRITIGDLWMRSRDMARLLILLCGDGSYEGTRVLSRESVLEMRLEQMDLGASVTGPSPYGLFLEHNDTFMNGITVYGHQGMSDGAILNAYFEPHSGFGMVLFSNGGSKNRQNRVGILARKFFGYFYEIYGQ